MSYIIQNKLLGSEAYPRTVAKAVIVRGKTLDEILEKGISKGYDFHLPQVRVDSKLLTVSGNDIIGLTISKNSIAAEVTYISKDMQFTEFCEISYQGNSTLNNPKKGFSIDFENKHRFQDWLEFNGFHLKGYYVDWTHSRDLVCNRLLEQIYQHRENIRPFIPYNDIAEPYRLMETGALCHIDGFPCELFINGTYWGLYSVNIKKTNDNYLLKKDNPNHIMLDPDNNTYIQTSGWDWKNIEIRCPKSIIKNMDGTKYNGDNPQEIQDGEVKTNILTWINWVSGITTSYTAEQLSERLNLEEFVDFYIFSWFIDNIDIVCKNTLWTTWDGVHWSPLSYDMDNTFGMYAFATGDAQHAPTYDTFGHKANDHATWIPKVVTILDSRIKARYAELRKDVLTLDNVKHLFNNFFREVGSDAYKKDLARWSYPSYGQSSNNFIFDIRKITTWTAGRITFLDNKFGYTE